MAKNVAVRLENLTKAFRGFRRKVVAVNNINLDIEAGQVFGFLGPNGAGKTTTIRMLLDLMNPTAGTVSIYGKPIRQHHEVLRQVGAHIEGAAFYPYLTGKRNLEVIARINDYYDPARIDQLLKQVGLGDEKRKRVGAYSLGMKQRLGLAASLLNNPTLLIMDEPTNGLDPAGIQEMRYFLRELVEKQGKTVVLSSHLLHEVEQMCDKVAIINRGEILRHGTVASLLSDSQRVRIEADPLDQAMTILGERWKVEQNTKTLYVEAAHEDIPHVLARLYENNINVYEVVKQKQSLEEFFLGVTGTNPQQPNEKELLSHEL